MHEILVLVDGDKIETIVPDFEDSTVAFALEAKVFFRSRYSDCNFS